MTSRRRVRLVCLLIVAGLLSAGCTSGESTVAEPAGFLLCSAVGDEAWTILPERRQEILTQAKDHGIAGGGDLGARGLGVDGPVQLDLFVLDDRTLETLERIAEPEEVCVRGQDPADYVERGPQTTSGEGWRWLGSSEVHPRPGEDPGLITTHDEFVATWSTLFSGNRVLPDVDFESESVLLLQTAMGGLPGPCAFRFDGISQNADGAVVAMMFLPGGTAECPTIVVWRTFVIVIEHSVIGEPPFEFSIQYGPRLEPDPEGTLG